MFRSIFKIRSFLSSGYRTPRGCCSSQAAIRIEQDHNEVIIVIEAYRTLGDQRPYLADQVVRDVTGKLAFVLFDSPPKATFTAVDVDRSFPFFWGSDSEGNLVSLRRCSSREEGPWETIAPFPKGCFFTSFRGLRSYEHPPNEVKQVPRVDISGQVCSATFKVDTETKESSMQESWECCELVHALLSCMLCGPFSARPLALEWPPVAYDPVTLSHTLTIFNSNGWLLYVENLR
ncbi:hypothetical protein NL676_029501 [Syzygium grande]|nr:hypothetical protein NL676_029501 [Syzygium grande]